jgi:hypothetical protein
MAMRREDLDRFGADESGGSLTNAVAFATTAMQPVWIARERLRTDSTRTERVRHPEVRAAAVK